MKKENYVFSRENIFVKTERNLKPRTSEQKVN